jgi:hypothetical protein
MKMDQMAVLLKCSPHTIQSLESRRRDLSEDMATRYFLQTGIDPQWLLNGDPKAPPITHLGTPYTKDIYDRTQARQGSLEKIDRASLMFEAAEITARFVAILLSAKKQRRWRMARYKARTAILKLMEEFGQDPEVYAPPDFSSYDMDQALPIVDELLDAVIFSGKTENVRARAAQEEKQRPKRKRA